PPELSVLGAEARWLVIRGLGTLEAQALLADKQLSGDAHTWANLAERYGGNGLALKIVAETIREVYEGDIHAFLRDVIATYGTVFGGIRRLLDIQVERLSGVEMYILTRLAVEREPISVAELTKGLPPTIGRGMLIAALAMLRRRSNVERGQ